MNNLPLHHEHARAGARFTAVADWQIPAAYGDPLAEYRALRDAVGLTDLSCRSRLGLIGADRVRFLNGQVTNDIAKLQTGQGCYAALVNAKGRIESDLVIYRLENEILLDFEPGMTSAVAKRLDKFVIADDVQIVDVTSDYGLLSVQGPRAAEALQQLGWIQAPPAAAFEIAHGTGPEATEVYVASNPRAHRPGFDLYLPAPALADAWTKLIPIVRGLGGRPTGWEAGEIHRIEAGIPRFGADMDPAHLAPETGIEARAISYSKGCYVGQEIIARIRTYGQVARALRGLRILEAQSDRLPQHGDKLYFEGKEAGHITSAVASPAVGGVIALGYVRRECNQTGQRLFLRDATGERAVEIAALPFG